MLLGDRSPADRVVTRAWVRLGPAALLIVAGIAAYANSFWGPFLFDDVSNILLNPAVQVAWPSLDQILRPMRNRMALRPLIDRSFALNYALGGFDVRGYHLFNLAIHLLAGLALFGWLRRTFELDRMPPWIRQHASGLALSVGLLWLVHPLQTGSVTYIVQRAESLMGLCYLTTLYSAVRAASSSRPGGWNAAAILACSLGMIAKPVIATAPVMVWLYDRPLLRDSARAKGSGRAALYAGLVATWVIPFVLMALAPKDADLSMGFGLKEVTALQYVATQPGVILHYLRLVVWPHPLILDYNWPIANTTEVIALPALAISALLGLTVWALAHRRALGLLGAWFFLTLAPTSSIFPLVDLAFEHRMYLALAAPMVGIVLLGWGLLQRLAPSDGGRVRIGSALVAGIALILGVATLRRNADYRSDIGMWQNVLKKRPGNARAYDNMAYIYAHQNRFSEAEAAIREAVRLKPEASEYHVNLGNILHLQGRIDESVASYRNALRQDRQDAVPYSNIAKILAEQGDLNGAVEMYRRAIELMRTVPELHHNLAGILAQQGRFQEAIESYREALRMAPEFEDSRYNLSMTYNYWGAMLFQQGKLDEAIQRFSEAARIHPGNESARTNLSKAIAVKQGLATPRR